MAVATGVSLWLIFLEPTWRESKALALSAEYQTTHDVQVGKELLQMLDLRELSASTGNEILERIFSPELLVRDQYLVGRKISVGVQTGCEVNLRRLVPEYSGEVIAGNEVLHRFETQSSLSRGLISQFEFSRGERIDGSVSALNATGLYSGRIILHLKLLPERDSKQKWPSSGPVPWNLWPERVALNPEKKIEAAPVYECKFDIPIKLRILLRSELTPLGKVSSPDLDRQMREAFQARPGMPGPGPSRLPSRQASKFRTRTNSTSVGIPSPVLPLLRDGPVISYQNLPADVALRAKFRDARAKEFVSTHFAFPRRAGESGTIWMVDMYDLFETFTPGKYKGDLILFTDEAVAYENPLITNIWSGTLTFPVDFTIDAPRTNQPPR